MSFFAQTAVTAKPKNRFAFFASLLVATILTAVAVAQLFTFEDLPAVLAGYALPGGEPSGSLLAALLVTVEVLAVPYLLMVRLSLLMRLLSLACGWTSCLIWLALGLQLMARGDGVINSGLLGATVVVSISWMPVLFAVGLAVGLAATGPIPRRRTVRA